MTLKLKQLEVKVRLCSSDFPDTKLYVETFLYVTIKYINTRATCNTFELQCVWSEVESIRYRATCTSNIANQRMSLTNLKIALNLTLHYNTLHYITPYTLQYIGVVHPYVTVLVGGCMPFGKLIRERKYGEGGCGSVHEMSLKYQIVMMVIFYLCRS